MRILARIRQWHLRRNCVLRQRPKGDEGGFLIRKHELVDDGHCAWTGTQFWRCKHCGAVWP